MYNFILAVHVIVCILLLVVILIQRGRGGGLVESLAGAESLFGTRTSSFLVKTTTVLAVVFFITSTSLAFLSKQKSKSIFDREKNILSKQQLGKPVKEKPVKEEPVKEKAKAKNPSPNVKPAKKQVNPSAK